MTNEMSKCSNDIDPKMVDSVKAHLSGDVLSNTLDFFDYLKENGMSLSLGFMHEERGFYYVFYEGVNICHTSLMVGKSRDGIEPNTMCFWPIGKFPCEPEGFPLNERMKATAQANANTCGKCGSCGKSDPGTPEVIFGRNFDKLCHTVIEIINPDREKIECLKKLMDMKKFVVDSEKQEQ